MFKKVSFFFSLIFMNYSFASEDTCLKFWNDYNSSILYIIKNYNLPEKNFIKKLKRKANLCRKDYDPQSIFCKFIDPLPLVEESSLKVLFNEFQNEVFEN